MTPAALAAGLLAAGSLLDGPTARAEPPRPGPPPLAETLVGAARSDYEAGRQLLRDHDDAAALIRFHHAYAREPDPRLLANIALCEHDLDHPARAAGLLARVLAEGAAAFGPEQLAQLRELLSDSLSKAGRLHVSVDPPGATVALDGEAVVQAPVSADLPVDAGPHQVRVSKPGYRDFVREITVGQGGRWPIDAKLDPDAREGTLRIHTGSQGAIAIDGRAVATASWEGRVSAGAHDVVVAAPGMRAYHAEVVVPEGGTRAIDVSLDPDRPPGAWAPTWLYVTGGAIVGAAILVSAASVFQ